MAFAINNCPQHQPLYRKLDVITMTWHGLVHIFPPKVHSMLKSELVQKLATQSPHLYQRDLERIVNLLLGEIIGALKNGDRVELRGFGTFTAKSRAARVGRNPRTGSAVVVDAKQAPSFKPSKDFHKRMNEDPPSSTQFQIPTGPESE